MTATATSRDRRRWWSVYTADGTRLEDVWLTAAAIRATLPGAVLDTVLGRVTIASGGVREGAKVDAEVDAD